MCLLYISCYRQEAETCPSVHHDFWLVSTLQIDFPEFQVKWLGLDRIIACSWENDRDKKQFIAVRQSFD